MKNFIRRYNTEIGYVASRNKVSRLLKAIGIVSFCFILTINSAYNNYKDTDDHFQAGGDGTSFHGIGRKLHQYGSSEKENCTRQAITNFPNDVFTQKQRRHGAVAFHLFASLYLFWAIAVCCDSYFVPSLQEMCDRLGLQTDVAGATLMAMGSSAPELFAAIIGVFVTKGDIGIGTILGSAVFNVLFVVGACGLLAGSVLTLSWWPMTRDAACYGISLFVLTIVIFDEEVKWYEAAIMVSLYPMYVVLMYFNSTLEKKTYQYIGDSQSIKARFQSKGKGEDSKVLLMDDADDRPEDPEDYTMMEMTQEDEESEKDVSSGYRETCQYARSVFTIPKGPLRAIIWILQLPITIVFFITIPDVKKEYCRKFYSIGFIVSIVWIGLLTYLLVWMVTIAGYTAGISDTVMGLTFVAFGSSVPDCLSSLLVARQGDGDMAVSHTIGSNVFDILLCLGVPWLIKTTMVSPREPVLILSHGLFISCFVILGSLLFAMTIISYNKWRLERFIGIVFLVAYLVFVILAIVLELSVFERLAPPPCV